MWIARNLIKGKQLFCSKYTQIQHRLCRNARDIEQNVNIQRKKVSNQAEMLKVEIFPVN